MSGPPKASQAGGRTVAWVTAALISLAVACPGFAQDWYEPDNVWTSANWILTDCAKQRHTIDPVADIDWIKFDAAAGDDYVIETHRAGAFPWCDTVIALYDPTGTYVTEDDDSGDVVFSRIMWTCPSAGTYYVATYEFGNDATGTYDISIASPHVADVYEYDDLFADAKWITWDGVKYRHSLNPMGDYDGFMFLATAGTQYVIETFEVGGVQVDTVLFLHDDGGGYIDDDDDSGQNTCSKITWTCPTSGVYRFEVHEYGNDALGVYDVSVTAIGDADLTAVAFSVTPNPSVLGTLLDCNITVHNAGSAAAGPCKMDVWYHRPDPVSVGSTGWNVRLDVPGLNAGGSFGAVPTFTPGFAGDRRARLFIDSLNSVAETDEWNNMALNDYVIVPGGAPDLIVANLTVTPNPSTLGTLLWYQATLENVGTAAAGPFSLDLWYHRTSAPVAGSAGHDFRYHIVAGLPAGGSVIRSVSFTPSYPGTRTARAYVDSQETVSETNEGNNTNSCTYTISSAGLPDLVPHELTVSPNPSTLGTLLTLTATVRNAGPGGVGAFRIAAWRHRPAPPVYGTSGDDNWSIPGLGDGATVTRTATYMPGYTGARRAWMYVDADRQVPEGNEANNVRFYDYSIVSGGLPDLVVQTIAVTPTPSTLGTQLVYNVTVRNQGTAATDSFRADHWYHRATPPVVGSGGCHVWTALSGLAAGASHAIEALHFTPNYPGNRTARCLVDALGEVPESNEGNNAGAAPYVINPVNGSGAGSPSRPRLE